MDEARDFAAVRPATRDDAAEIARLLTVLGHPTSAADVTARWDYWAMANSALVVDRTGGGLAGLATLHRMAVLHRPRQVGRITALVVDADQRGLGIGRLLVAAAEAAFAAAGCGLSEVTSNLRLVDAHAFYERLGYDRTSARFVRSVTSSSVPRRG